METSHPRNLVEHARDSVARFATRPLFGERRDGQWQWITYAQWQDGVDALRGGLAELGVKAGDRVAIISRNSSAWATAAYAVYGLGATFVPMYEAQRPEDWEFILQDCGATVVFGRTSAIVRALQEMRPRLPALRHVVTIEPDHDAPDALTLDEVERRGRAAPVATVSPSPDDIAGFVYTSGTTGKPKGVMLTHGNLTSNVVATLETFPLGKDDRSVSFLPWAHVYGQACELHMLIGAGASTAFNANTEHVVDDVRDVKPTILVAVPRVFNRLHAKVRSEIDEKPAFIRKLFWRGLRVSIARRAGKPIGFWDRVALLLAGVLFGVVRKKLGGRLRYAISASATLSREVAEFIDGLGIEVYEGYGLTETSPVVTVNSPGHRKLGSVGRPIPGVRIAIDTTLGSAPGEGEIIVYGPNVMQGYHARPEENARAFSSDGGLRTGDLGHVDDDGFLFITGRIKEQYKLENGKYVMPTPLEERLQLSPFIRNVMLYGANHPYNVALVCVESDQIRAWAHDGGVELAADITEDERVRALIRDELARTASTFRGYEKPLDFVLTETQFTTDNGLLTPTFKLKRAAVIARFGAALEALYERPTPERAVRAPAAPPSLTPVLTAR